MEIGKTLYGESVKTSASNPIRTEGKQKERFSSIYDEALSHPSIPPAFRNHPHALTSFGNGDRPAETSGGREMISHRNPSIPYVNGNGMHGLKKYKDDQLLSNPGGDDYYLDQNDVIKKDKDQQSFRKRIGKDLSDSFGNAKNLIGDLFFGSKIHYRDGENKIQEAQRRGIAGSVVDFFKDLGSAFSFGAWRPDGEAPPEGFLKRCGFFFTKIKEALFGDLLQGVGGSAIHAGEDLLFAGWNLLETIPDATIGNHEIGRKITTSFFDNGQVLLDYFTDILPSGDAWVRVHSMKLKDFSPPFLNNIRTPEYNNDDSRWKYVRNTSFRKGIETIGTALVDILTLRILGNVRFFSEDRHHRN